jgi:hypothetical protein
VNVAIIALLLPALWLLGEAANVSTSLLRPRPDATLSVTEALQCLVTANVNLVLFNLIPRSHLTEAASCSACGWSGGVRRTGRPHLPAAVADSAGRSAVEARQNRIPARATMAFSHANV